jgi:hypothetical protein
MSHPAGIAAMSKHTPGPWEVTCDDSDGSHVIRMASAIEDRGKYEPQHIINYEHGLDPDEDEDQFDEAEANARLIAEAPAMEELLEQLVEYADELNDEDQRDVKAWIGLGMGCYHQLAPLARTILARIQGEGGGRP